MTYTAKLILMGRVIMQRHGRTRQDAIDALGFVGGPGYRVEVERVGVLA